MKPYIGDDISVPRNHNWYKKTLQNKHVSLDAGLPNRNDTVG